MRTPVKSLLIACTFIAALGTSLASAATTTGRVTALNVPAHRLVLGHHVFHLSKAMKTGGLHKGERFALTYHWSHGKRLVTAYQPIASKAASKTITN